jgi:DNA-binding NtrC family response regulator
MLPSAFGVTDRVLLTLHEARASFERRFVSGALARAGGRREQAALELGISRQELTKLLKRLGLDVSATSPIQTSYSQ